MSKHLLCFIFCCMSSFYTFCAAIPIIYILYSIPCARYGSPYYCSSILYILCLTPSILYILYKVCYNTLCYLQYHLCSLPPPSILFLIISSIILFDSALSGQTVCTIYHSPFHSLLKIRLILLKIYTIPYNYPKL